MTRTLDCALAPRPPILSASAGSIERTTLSVLTYNIEGLGWPARSGRASQLKEIGARLAQLRGEGRAPDIVMFQEVFSGSAKKAVAATGYPAIAPGPRRLERGAALYQERLPGSAKIAHGELGIRIYGGGLAVASRYPIIDAQSEGYGRKSCAGLDCLANKGIQLVRIALPGVPGAIDIYNTHMNSRRASRAPRARHLAAHNRQVAEAAQFIASTRQAAGPVIFGGDFNMRHSEARFERFNQDQRLQLVHKICADERAGCSVKMSWDGDAPWMDTQDLQLFDSGRLVTVRPIRVEAMFDGSAAGGPTLSDHDGFLVTYELSWPAGVTSVSGCGSTAAKS